MRAPVDFERFFAPRRVAVVGASDREGGVATMNWRMLRGWLEPRGVEVVPVNPSRAAVDGVACCPSLRAVEGEVDVAVILVGADAAEQAVADAIAEKVPFAVLFGAGFAESGPEGAARQDRVLAAVRACDLRLLGPNTTLNAFQPFRGDLPGKAVALITQSGHQGRPLYQAQELGVRVSHWAPTGNEADLDAADFVRWLADREEVGAIACYLEGVADGPAFRDAAQHAARRRVPLVAVKVGRSEVGRSWARSHSGHLAGSDAVTDAVFAQHGITRVDGLDELADTAMLLARAPAPEGDGVAIYSISGGTGAHVADLAAAAGLRLASLSQGTQDLLHQWIAPYLRVSNPVDSGGHPSGDHRGPLILEAILADPDVAVLVVPFAGSFSPISERFAADVVAAAARTTKPVCVVWGSPVGLEEAYRDILLPSPVPVFRTVRSCLTAVRGYLDWHAFLAGRATGAVPVSHVEDVPDRHTSGAVSGRHVLDVRDRNTLAASERHGRLAPGPWSELASKRLLATYGVPVAADVLVAGEDAAVAAAAALDGPAVLKASGAGFAHKSEAGLVHLGVVGEEAVRTAYRAIVRAAVAAVSHASPGSPEDGWDGVVVCPQVSGGVELILGVVRDEVFGPAVLLGVGGVAVEVYGDVALRVPPFGREEARRMLGELRGLPLLTGHRGRPAADLDAVLDAVMAVQRLALDHADDLAELDVNPLLARPDGVVALDALVVGR